MQTTGTLIRGEDCTAQPWKNGLGVTRQIAAFPEHAGLADFIWRISVAEVAAAGPFSLFPGIDRQIVLLRGAGFHMDFADGQTHALDGAFAPFAFRGEAPIRTRLIDGPTTDFNLMVRRDAGRGRVACWRGASRQRTGRDDVLVYCAHGSVEIDGIELAPGDAWRAQAGGPSPMDAVLSDGAVALVVAFAPTARTGTG